MLRSWSRWPSTTSASAAGRVSFAEVLVDPLLRHRQRVLIGLDLRGESAAQETRRVGQQSCRDRSGSLDEHPGAPARAWLVGQKFDAPAAMGRTARDDLRDALGVRIVDGEPADQPRSARAHDAGAVRTLELGEPLQAGDGPSYLGQAQLGGKGHAPVAHVDALVAEQDDHDLGGRAEDGEVTDVAEGALAPRAAHALPAPQLEPGLGLQAPHDAARLESGQAKPLGEAGGTEEQPGVLPEK